MALSLTMASAIASIGHALDRSDGRGHRQAEGQIPQRRLRSVLALPHPKRPGTPASGRQMERRRKVVTPKPLGMVKRLYPLSFQTLVGPLRAKVFVFFRAAAWPVDDHAVDFVALGEARGHREFGL